MGYWGWRPLVLILCISVWVTSCTTTYENAPTHPPTSLPPVTIILRSRTTLTPSPTFGLPNLVSPQPTPTPTVHIFASLPTPFLPLTPLSLYLTPTPHLLLLFSPTCYEVLPDGIICLGTIENILPQPLTHVALLIELFGKDGMPLQASELLLEQRLIMPGEAAPYRALFTPQAETSLIEQYGGVTATLRRADSAAFGSMTLMRVENVQIEVQASRYRLTAEILNPTQTEALALRIVATIYDDAGRVTGYRVVSADSLGAGERLPISVEIVPQSPPVDNRVPRYTLHAEAQQSAP